MARDEVARQEAERTGSGLSLNWLRVFPIGLTS